MNFHFEMPSAEVSVHRRLSTDSHVGRIARFLLEEHYKQVDRFARIEARLESQPEGWLQDIEEARSEIGAETREALKKVQGRHIYWRSSGTSDGLRGAQCTPAKSPRSLVCSSRRRISSSACSSRKRDWAPIRGCAADRLSERVPVLAAVLDQVGRPLREPPERALDLSGGGARVRIPIELEADDPTTAILRLPDGPLIHVAGHIVRRNDDGTVSLAFDRISPSDRERLIRYVFTRLQTALHVRSGGS